MRLKVKRMSFQVGERMAVKIAQLMEGTVFPLGENVHGMPTSTTLGNHLITCPFLALKQRTGTMLPAEIYMLKTTAAIFICAFSLSQSNLADMFDM